MIFYHFAQTVAFLLSKLFFPIKIVGFENIPRQGSYILASNHVSYLDPVVLGIICPRYVSFVAKESLFENWILGFGLRKLQAFPIRRNFADVGALREGLRRLKRGSSLLIFPEGTRKGEPGHKEPQPGIGFWVVKSGALVVPIWVSGTEKVLPAGAKFFKRHPVTVVFGKPVSFASDEPYPQIAERILQAIYALQ